MKRILLTSTILLTSSAWAVDSQFTVRHRESSGVGYNKGYSTLDYTLTTQENQLEFLLNLRGHLFNDGRTAGNTGLGVRYSLNDDSSRVGMNVFYDFRDYSRFFAQQVSGGLEWISHVVDLRLNGYLPVGKHRSFQVQELRYRGITGNEVLAKRKLSAALPSIEGEIGIPLADPFYFAVGSYYLFRESSHSIPVGKALGWKARFDVNLGRYFTLGALATRDSIFKTRVQGYLSLNIPLRPWKSTKDGSRDLRRVPIVRNEIIPIQARHDSKLYFRAGNASQPVTLLPTNNETATSSSAVLETSDVQSEESVTALENPLSLNNAVDDAARILSEDIPPVGSTVSEFEPHVESTDSVDSTQKPIDPNQNSVAEDQPASSEDLSLISNVNPESSDARYPQASYSEIQSPVEPVSSLNSSKNSEDSSSTSTIISESSESLSPQVKEEQIEGLLPMESEEPFHTNEEEMALNDHVELDSFRV